MGENSEELPLMQSWTMFKSIIYEVQKRFKCLRATKICLYFETTFHNFSTNDGQNMVYPFFHFRP